MTITVCWDVTPSSLADSYPRIGNAENEGNRFPQSVDTYYQSTRHHIPEVCNVQRNIRLLL